MAAKRGDRVYNAKERIAALQAIINKQKAVITRYRNMIAELEMRKDASEVIAELDERIYMLQRENYFLRNGIIGEDIEEYIRKKYG